ncbi:hypothetical protein ACN27J_18125 [Solwaraspora sp. WMMB762]|uniref:hypothetical protein n=1 Tax=Solwaraspora sp. WMMB762 TaxID=3404120 RepID=UPI003B925B05
MDDTFLRRAAGAAGYRLANDRLTEAAIEQPEHVANWCRFRRSFTGRVPTTVAVTDATYDPYQHTMALLHSGDGIAQPTSGRSRMRSTVA